MTRKELKALRRTKAVKKKQNINKAQSAAAMVAASAVLATSNISAQIEEIVVTSRKKEETLQDVPLQVSTLTEESLEASGINTFEDYLLELPGVTAGGSGPGQNTIYIRGLASTTPNLTTAGVAGLAPNVSFYLDEQPLAQPGRNLDVYAADVARIEVLSGPQGTLFGASSQAGVVRMITNKPKMGVSESNVEFEYRFTPEGDTGSKIEAMTNIPLGESTALRVVAYKDDKGGYIDQVAGKVDVTESARYRSAGYVRQNGLPVSSARAGFKAGTDFSGATIIPAIAIQEEDANDSTYQGFRASLAQDLSDEWSANLVLAHQKIDADGVFFADPTLGDLEIQTYTANSIDDQYDNMSLTLDGMIGDLEVVYAGAYTDRETNQLVDYTDYLFVGQYLPYYICDYYVSYPQGGAATGTCGGPNLLVDSTTNTEVTSHEIRINADISDTMSITAGAFMSDTELLELNLFTYPETLNNNTDYACNYALTDTSVTGSINNASPGWFSAGPFCEPVIFFNDIKRTDEQKGFFGELNIALSDTSELTLGARWYDIEVDFEGSANSSFYNADGPPSWMNATTDTQQFGSNLSAQYAPGNANGYPDTASTDGVIGKVTYSWNPSDEVMYYLTWSEGFRPGLLNRPVGASNAAGTYSVKPEVKSDEVTNYEFGWKTVLLDGQLRFNGSAFYVDVEGLQTTIFDPSIVNLFFSDNAADGEITGVEGDFTYYADKEGLTVSGAFSVLDTEITKKLLPTNDVIVGTEMAFAPGFQANLRVRQEWEMSNGYTGHAQVSLTHSGDSFSDVMEPNKAVQQQYSYMDVRFGMSDGETTAEFYIDNVTDERAEISNTFVFDRQRVSYIRPMTMGIRYKRNF